MSYPHTFRAYVSKIIHETIADFMLWKGLEKSFLMIQNSQQFV